MFCIQQSSDNSYQFRHFQADEIRLKYVSLRLCVHLITWIILYIHLPVTTVRVGDSVAHVSTTLHVIARNGLIRDECIMKNRYKNNNDNNTIV